MGGIYACPRGRVSGAKSTRHGPSYVTSEPGRWLLPASQAGVGQYVSHSPDPKPICGLQVVLGLQKEPEFLPELFKRLEAGPSDPAWGDLLAFLQEMCGLAKHLQPTNCTALMTRLHHLGLFQVRAGLPAGL